MFKKVASVFVLAFGASILSLACSAQTDNTEETATSTDDLTAAQTACTTDDDCVAISKGGCCPNGELVAVNKTHEKSYDKSHTCKTPPTACPLAMRLDTRVAQCNTKNKCALIAPEDISCGGFVMHPHQCPSGFECDFTGKNPDLPGACVKTAPKDCRSTGCSGTSSCQMCWGNFACVPHGAMC
jgi:hypothetical protein